MHLRFLVDPTLDNKEHSQVPFISSNAMAPSHWALLSRGVAMAPRRAPPQNHGQMRKALAWPGAAKPWHHPTIGNDQHLGTRKTNSLTIEIIN